MDDEERNCNVCGRPVMYGERHSQCGAAVIAAVAAEREACAMACREVAQKQGTLARQFAAIDCESAVRARSNST